VYSASNGIGRRTEFVAEVLVNEGHLDAEFFQALVQKLLHQAAEFDFAEVQMAVLVVNTLPKRSIWPSGNASTNPFSPIASMSLRQG